MKIAYIVGEKIFEDKEEAQIYEEKENQYNEIIEKYLFDKWQKEQIKLGVEKGLDVSWYAKPEFEHYQMREIREGLEDGLDVSIYSKNYLDWEQMQQIKKGLKEKLDVNI